MHTKSPSPSVQTGSGVPQNRSRDSAQSTLFSSQLPKRPAWMCAGTHLIVSLSATMRRLYAVVRMYHAFFA